MFHHFGPWRHGRAGEPDFGPVDRPFQAHRPRWVEGDEWAGPPFGPFGRHWRRFGRGVERRFGKGDLKYVILDLLKEQPRHGYDIIRALEERFRGLYSPSPGAVYPTLQMLEDQGYVASTQQDGKKVYTLTDAGRRFLDEQAATLEDIHDRVRGWWGPGMPEAMGTLGREMQALAWTLFDPSARGWWSDPAKVSQVRAALARAREDIARVLRETSRPPTV